MSDSLEDSAFMALNISITTKLSHGINTNLYPHEP